MTTGNKSITSFLPMKWRELESFFFLFMKNIIKDNYDTLCLRLLSSGFSDPIIVLSFELLPLSLQLMLKN